jgi:hypothetical protein
MKNGAVSNAQIVAINSAWRLTSITIKLPQEQLAAIDLMATRRGKARDFVLRDIILRAVADTLQELD